MVLKVNFFSQSVLSLEHFGYGESQNHANSSCGLNKKQADFTRNSNDMQLTEYESNQGNEGAMKDLNLKLIMVRFGICRETPHGLEITLISYNHFELILH